MENYNLSEIVSEIVRTYSPASDNSNDRFKEIIKDIKLDNVVSFATRPMREGETNGVEHWFITTEEAQDKIKNSQILAYTKIGETGYEYFVTKEDLHGANLYIIDPKGIEYLKSHNPDINIKVIYIWISEDTRLSRASKRSDFNTAFEKRNKDESEQFDRFEKDEKWDIKIENYNFDLSIIEFIKFIIDNYTSDTLFCIAGRTASGKDSLVQSVKEIINNA